MQQPSAQVYRIQLCATRRCLQRCRVSGKRADARAQRLSANPCVRLCMCFTFYLQHRHLRGRRSSFRLMNIFNILPHIPPFTDWHYFHSPTRAPHPL